MSQQARDKLVGEIRDWQRLGLIDAASANDLSELYGTRDWLQAALRWLGVFAIFLLGSGILSLVGLAVSGSPLLAGPLLGLGSAAGCYFGGRLASSPQRRHSVTGSILLTVGLVAAYGCLSLLYIAAGGKRYDAAYPWLMLITAAAAVLTAYRFRLRWPLLLGLLLLFHGVGSWHAYGGSGSYFADIQDERVMAVVALLSVIIGWVHETYGEAGPLRRHHGFGSLYLIFGLLYLNLSLWFLTLPHTQLSYVLLFTAAALVQIIAGARLKDARFTGFGIVFLSINIYTRFFEQFWDRLSAGTFFLVAGIAGVGIGLAIERRALSEALAAARRSPRS